MGTTAIISATTNQGYANANEENFYYSLQCHISFQVTSKPDLYPLVISYNGDTVVKAGNGSTGYLMVQYFRNFIGRPAGK